MALDFSGLLVAFIVDGCGIVVVLRDMAMKHSQRSPTLKG